MARPRGGAAGWIVLVIVGVAAINGHYQAFQIAIIDFHLQHGNPDGLIAQLHAAGVPFIFCTDASIVEIVESFPEARVVQAVWR